MTKMLCNINKILLDVLQVINENGKGIAFIVDDRNKLHGILTDGDIRKLLLEGCKLQEPIKNLINKDFIYAFSNENPLDVIGKTNDKIKIIPIIDENHNYVDFFEFSNRIHIPIASPLLNGNELKYLTDAFLSTWISSAGKYIDLFENEFSKFCECKYGIAVSNGTVALHLALLALGIGKGDEVIVPDLTFAATINAILHCNATPVIVDIEKDSWCIDPLEIEKAITPKTKAIIPVHIYGQPCDMNSIMKIAKNHKLFVIEDCAEAHGARYNDKKVGSYGDIGCFSFFGNKVITTGEGGMCVTNSQELAEKIRILKDHGMSKTKKYWHDVIGYNYRMTNLQASIGLAQLERVNFILEYRKKIENDYIRLLSEIDFIEFQKNNLPKREKITWIVSVLIKSGNRDTLLQRLMEKGIDARPFFYPLSSMDIYKKFVFSNKICKEIASSGINFPTNSSVNKKIIEKIKEIILSNQLI
ncbi:MAG: aminotransferase class I/II-fold pyridoxal phosphate-dependent enzyme [Bacteroidales bacterium]|jgi:perosamine synthetase